MATIFKEEFNYPDGDLNGNGGWSAPTNFYIFDKQLFINGNVTRTATKDVTAGGTPPIMQFYAYVCMTKSHGNMNFIFGLQVVP